jgi:hypothetical protein
MTKPAAGLETCLPPPINTQTGLRPRKLEL